MPIQCRDKINPGNQSIKRNFSNKMAPQIFVDTEMILRSFTETALDLFRISKEDIGKSLYTLKDKMAHNALIENIRGVLLVEISKEKHIQNWNGQWYKMKVQPHFDQELEQIDGVIVTYFEINEEVLQKKESDDPKFQYETMLIAPSQDIRKSLSKIINICDSLYKAHDLMDKNLINNCLEELMEKTKYLKTFIEKVSTETQFSPNINLDERSSYEDILRKSQYTFYR